MPQATSQQQQQSEPCPIERALDGVDELHVIAAEHGARLAVLEEYKRLQEALASAQSALNEEMRIAHRIAKWVVMLVGGAFVLAVFSGFLALLKLAWSLAP